MFPQFYMGGLYCYHLEYTRLVKIGQEEKSGKDERRWSQQIFFDDQASADTHHSCNLFRLVQHPTITRFFTMKPPMNVDGVLTTPKAEEICFWEEYYKGVLLARDRESLYACTQHLERVLSLLNVQTYWWFICNIITKDE